MNRRRAVDFRLWRRRRVPVVLQGESAECSLACLAMIAGYHGAQQSLHVMRSRFGLSDRGATLEQVAAMAGAIQLAARPVSLELAELSALRLPCILHWNFDHFVVLDAVRRRRLDIVDPVTGRQRISLRDASRMFTGVAMELTPTASFRRRRRGTGLTLRRFVGVNPGLAGVLLQTLGLSLVLQMFALAAPYYSQLVLDEVMVSADRRLLITLALVFFALAVSRVVVQMIRGWLILLVGTRLRFAWVVRLFHHLLRLPLGFFQRRHVGDIVSRFGSVTAVQNLVTTAVVEAVVDGALALTTLALMMAYSTKLGAIALAALLVQLILRLALFPVQRRAQQDSLAVQAKEQSHFLETLRSAQTLKCLAAESHRSRHWQNAVTDSLNQGVKISALIMFESGLAQLVGTAETIALLSVGSLLVLTGDLSVGMLIAFLAWRGLFAGAMGGLLQRWFEWRLIGLHLERLADIVLSEPEPAPDRQLPRPMRGSIRLRRVGFAHARSEDELIYVSSLTIEAGQLVALTGPSGCGKSTLLKLMLGLLAPGRGAVLVDGMDLRQINPGSYRQQVAAVLQDDSLLAGTLRDNIAGFAPVVDEKRLLASARLVGIHREIARMPMGYLSLVGDMGGSLSGGQVQRLLLARALYRRPRILFLDEATSHLDSRAEIQINALVARLKMTRIMVSHQPEALSMADAVINLG